jgi:hypothetical protein
MMRTITIQPSSNILSVVYDEEAMLLFVTFKRGKTYAFSQVPGNVADGFSQALSAGQYFNTNVREQFTHELLGQ